MKLDINRKNYITIAANFDFVLLISILLLLIFLSGCVVHRSACKNGSPNSKCLCGYSMSFETLNLSERESYKFDFVSCRKGTYKFFARPCGSENATIMVELISPEQGCIFCKVLDLRLSSSSGLNVRVDSKPRLNFIPWSILLNEQSVRLTTIRHNENDTIVRNEDIRMELGPCANTLVFRTKANHHYSLLVTVLEQRKLTTPRFVNIGFTRVEGIPNIKEEKR